VRALSCKFHEEAYHKKHGFTSVQITPSNTTMLRTVFAVTLCILALQCYSSAALAPHLQCDAFWDAITFCSGSSSVAVWERRWCERCCEGLTAPDTGLASDVFSAGTTTPAVSDSRSLQLAMRRSSQLVAGSIQSPENRGDSFGPSTCRTSGASCTGTQSCCSGFINVGGVCTADSLGPYTRKSSGASCTGTQVCCSGLVLVDGVCQPVKRSTDSEIEKRVVPTVTGDELCHHFWSLSGPESYEGSCFIRRLAVHLPSTYQVNNEKDSDYCTGVPVAVPDSLTFGSPVPDRSVAGLTHTLTAGPGTEMDMFDSSDFGSDDDGLGPSTCRTSGASVTGTQTCCSGLIPTSGVCVTDTLGPSTCRTSGASVTGTQNCCSSLVNVNGVCTPV
jgi:hypothetical protein